MGDIWKAACENEIRLPCQKESAKKSVVLAFGECMAEILGRY